MTPVGIPAADSSLIIASRCFGPAVRLHAALELVVERRHADVHRDELLLGESAE